MNRQRKAAEIDRLKGTNRIPETLNELKGTTPTRYGCAGFVEILSSAGPARVSSMLPYKKNAPSAAALGAGPSPKNSRMLPRGPPRPPRTGSGDGSCEKRIVMVIDNAAHKTRRH